MIISDVGFKAVTYVMQMTKPSHHCCLSFRLIKREMHMNMTFAGHVARYLSVLSIVITLTLPVSAKDEWNPGKRMRFATQGLVVKIGTVTPDAAVRFANKDHCVFGGFVKQSESCRLRWKLEQGTTYTFIASGDGFASDVDLSIKSEYGTRPLVQDTSIERDAVVMFTPKATDWYMIDTKLASGKQGKGAFISMVVLSNNGYSIPLSNLTKAFDELFDSCSTFNDLEVTQGRKTVFAEKNESWSLVGGVVRTGQKLGIDNVSLTSGKHAIVAAGDNSLLDSDLKVTRDGLTVVSDTRLYKKAFVSFDVKSNAMHNVTLTNYKSNGLSFVIFAMLTVLK